MKKTFDAVSTMRGARQKLAGQWEGKPREEEIEALREICQPNREKEARAGLDYTENAFLPVFRLTNWSHMSGPFWKSGTQNADMEGRCQISTTSRGKFFFWQCLHINIWPNQEL